MLFATCGANAQQKLLRFVEKGTGKPVQDADVYTDTSFIAATNYNGNVKVDINGNFSDLIVNHVNYEKRTIPRDSLAVQKVYQLKKLAHVLDEVVLNSKSQNDSLADVKHNFHWGEKAATFIARQNDNYISKIKYRVTNVGGVKGLNYLPFKANIYTYDTLTKLPGTALIPYDILVENKTGADWAVADVSAYKVKVPKEGLCVVFIIPLKDKITYDDFVWSRWGRIAAVPALEFAGNSKNSFSFLYDFVFTGTNYIMAWRRVKSKYYKIEIELTE